MQQKTRILHGMKVAEIQAYLSAAFGARPSFSVPGVGRFVRRLTTSGEDAGTFFFAFTPGDESSVERLVSYIAEKDRISEAEAEQKAIELGAGISQALKDGALDLGDYGVLKQDGEKVAFDAKRQPFKPKGDSSASPAPTPPPKAADPPKAPKKSDQSESTPPPKAADPPKAPEKSDQSAPTPPPKAADPPKAPKKSDQPAPTPPPKAADQPKAPKTSDQSAPTPPPKAADQPKAPEKSDQSESTASPKATDKKQQENKSKTAAGAGATADTKPKGASQQKETAETPPAQKTGGPPKMSRHQPPNKPQPAAGRRETSRGNWIAGLMMVLMVGLVVGGWLWVRYRATTDDSRQLLSSTQQQSTAQDDAQAADASGKTTSDSDASGSEVSGSEADTDEATAEEPTALAAEGEATDGDQTDTKKTLRRPKPDAPTTDAPKNDTPTRKADAPNSADTRQPSDPPAANGLIRRVYHVLLKPDNRTAAQADSLAKTLEDKDINIKRLPGDQDGLYDLSVFETEDRDEAVQQSRSIYTTHGLPTKVLIRNYKQAE